MAAPDYATEIAALEVAASSGELTVESDGERVTYRSLAEVLRALDYFRSKAIAAASPNRRSASTVAAFAPE